MIKYTQQLETIISAHETALNDLGDKVRTEVIIPFCRKHRCKFLNGMGMYLFTKGDKTYNGDDFPKGKFGAEMKEIFNLLDTSITYNTYLGFYVGDYQ